MSEETIKPEDASAPNGPRNPTVPGQDPTGFPGPPPPPGPIPAVERKGKYAFSPPSGAHDWWDINDMERMYAVVSIQAGIPSAEVIARFAWGAIREGE